MSSLTYYVSLSKESLNSIKNNNITFNGVYLIILKVYYIHDSTLVLFSGVVTCDGDTIGQYPVG